jgi:autotransporter translocation and assembly factor TamB
VKQPLDGVFSGSIHLTSINPIRFDGDVRAASLVFQGQTIRDLQTHVQYDAPVVTLQNLSIADSGSTLSGKATYNPTSDAITFDVQIASVDLQRLREFGMPDSVEGRIQQAHLTGSGTRTRPQVDGTAQLRNLAFHGESFPTASVKIDTKGSEGRSSTVLIPAIWISTRISIRPEPITRLMLMQVSLDIPLNGWRASLEVR